MPNLFVPVMTLSHQKYDREFCVRFFGSYDFSWFTCERVYPYDGQNLASKGGSSRLDSAFNVALEEAHQMAKILDSGEIEILNSKPKPYTKITVNRVIGPVKLKKIEEHTQACNCKANDKNPCSRSSDCINTYLLTECNKFTCPAGAKCQNQKLRNREYAEIKIVKTKSRGFGAVCIKDIPEDTFVIEYVGELIDTNELNKRMNAKIKNKEKVSSSTFKLTEGVKYLRFQDFYFLTIEADLYVDAEPAGNLARFINHSCNPNCVTRKVLVDGNTRIGIFTNEPIKAVSID